MPNNELSLNIEDSKILQNLCGPMDEHIIQIASHFDVRILRHGDHFQIKGHNADSAINSLKYFYALAKIRNLDAEDIQNGLATGSHEYMDNQNKIIA